ncbi:hypothetical protein [Vitiosangium sp. GDMCC 1.1324]|uniref:hypothetical protein n=1 Tax=Vitiosangium sp. (strain GDMCC 1.1324) TaxID=2138576 RepID=UPI000D3CF6E3|nr:hypothetical protein [Vitiosangium sp. GDMCC 1.1324]PTL78674.1 hypothetical protein DAT35_37005 [Vitiosangium sp. GDMCC 1.1324]
MWLALALSSVLAATVPDGWILVPEPSEEQVGCANHSRLAWRVSSDKNGVRVEPEPDPEHDTGARLPFALPKELHVGGTRHVLAVPDGFLVGSDAGEWGGGLFWFSSDGKTWRQLANENVNGLVQLGPGEVLSLHGLNHLGMRRGAARWLVQDAQRQWTVSETKMLDAGPQAFVSTPEALYVVTADSLTRIGRDRQVSVLQPLPTAILYPNSMTADSHGTLWVGMRHFVLRLTPSGKGFSREWFVPKDCARIKQQDFECVCVK